MSFATFARRLFRAALLWCSAVGAAALLLLTGLRLARRAYGADPRV